MNNISVRIKNWIYRELSKIKTMYVRRFYKRVEVGTDSLVYFKSSVVNASRLGGVKIGANCSIGHSPFLYHSGMPFYSTILIDGDDSVVEIGDNCRINGAYIHAKKKITIGKNCVIASGVNIVDCNGHETYSNDRTVGRDNPEKIDIGENVWIGVNAIILKGTKIGNNSVVSAGSVVKGEFPNNTLIVGNPAVAVKHLNI